jgi:DNA-binding transcriptional MerR regulator
MTTIAKKTFTLGEAALVLGKNPATLISWELKGLVVPKRNKAGYRIYTSSQLKSVKTKLKKNNGRLYLAA